MPFDALVGRLQRIVQALEAGSVGLEESIAPLPRGAAAARGLARSGCKRAELTITELGRAAGAERRCRRPTPRQ